MSQLVACGNNAFEDYLLIKYVQLECGYADGNVFIEISDAVSLIHFIFPGGPSPCAACP